ncbi:MAG: prepilin-type N-terminal cleavage/methylation domain-containing protein [Gemmatimonadetes bacterium]|nr:MAG: prepilin-type N-terminal cleavage/methylation domain-containing protein [Gemmatimonadota bacterium]
MHARTDGFTLIELLIVVVIIGILAAIAIPKFSSVRERAYFSAMKSDLKNLATQQEVYYNAQYAFGSQLTDVGATQSEGVTVTINEATGTGWSATATHSGLPGEQCGVYHGDASPAGGSPATQVSLVMCSGG